MICPICEKKGISVFSPVWYNNNVAEACRDCILKLNLKGIKVRMDKERVPHWKAQIPARLENEL